MQAIGRIVGFAVLGALVLPALMLIVMIGVYLADSRCGAPGDSGGCEMGIAMAVLTAAPVGAAIGLAAGVWRSIRLGPKNR